MKIKYWLKKFKVECQMKSLPPFDICGYCNHNTEIVKHKDQGYPHKLDYGFILLCKNCNAYCGCHRGTKQPLGYVADKELQYLRRRAHFLLDPLWQSGQMTRSQCYARMAEILNIKKEDAHISQLNMEQINKLIRSLERRIRGSG